MTEAVHVGVFSRPLDQCLAPFNANDLRATMGDGQGEVAKAAEHIGNAFARLCRQQAHGLGDQRMVNGGINLRELGWGEVE